MTDESPKPNTETPASPSLGGPAGPTVPVVQDSAQGFRRSRRGGPASPRLGGQFRGGRSGRPGRQRGPVEKPEFDQRTLDIARVARVTKGGKRFSFRATVVAGNGAGRVGVGVANGRDVQQSIQKAYHQAKRNLVTIVIKQGTIPYQVEGKYSSATVLLKPSRSGVRAGGAMRVIAQLGGISSLTGKITRRTNNKINIARATIEALKSLRIHNS